jgi:ABC-type nitrate/sulfonate/bicarbonate transport system permease component
MNPGTLLSNVRRLPAIYHVIAVEVTTWQSWGVYWILFGLAAFILLWHWRTLSNRLLLAGTLLPFALYSAIYIFSAWDFYLDHVASSVPRLLAQFVPATLLGIGAALAQFIARRAPDAVSAPASDPA